MDAKSFYAEKEKETGVDYDSYVDSIIHLIIPALIKNRSTDTLTIGKFKIKLGKLYEGLPYHKYLLITKQKPFDDAGLYEVWFFDAFPFMWKVNIMPVSTIETFVETYFELVESKVNEDIATKLNDLVSRLKQ